MAYIGALGDIAFSVSSEQAETFSKMQWSGSARISTHQRHMGNALTEFTGRDADTMSFTMTISAYLGVDVMAEIVKIWDAERNGTTLPLVIGEKAYGKYRWLIKSHKTDMQYYDRNGNLTSATVSIQLIEYLIK
ncbi:MAG: phage tail protein [Oscillospiraceae bacterium]|jgi:hypothetical protein|nr:phage tail protein [Oscillospiraceae bacterium]